MFNKIRNELMNDEDDGPLNGKVEADETSWGGKPRKPHKTRSEAMKFRERKTTILGMVERGGRVRARVVPARRGEAFSQEVRDHINPDSILYTDSWVAYKPLSGHLQEGVEPLVAVLRDEHTWRWNARYQSGSLFSQLLARAARS